MIAQMDDSDTRPEGRLPFRSLPLAQREVALLIVLCVVSAITFAGTQRLAAWSRHRRAAAAAQWYAEGVRLTSAGQTEKGTASLREAVALERQNPTFVLALARALADGSRHDEAKQLLLQLRQNQPDDVEINLRLARIAAATRDDAGAVRYYNYAMYGLARVGGDFDRRSIRSELIQYLLDRGDSQEASTQLEALTRELPDTAGAHLEAGRLADRAGETSLAFQQYMQAGRRDEKNAEAAAGAGRTAYELRDFKSAVREIERAIALGATMPGLPSQLEVARLVISSDPLASGIGAAERTRRMQAGLAQAISRHQACTAATGADPKAADPIRADLDRLRRLPRSAWLDPDVLAGAVARVGDVEDDALTRCPDSIGALDRAWLFIAELHRSPGA
jgi:tetratricopeptide (TPR) repeat protein